jgi:hypothetical protein
MKLTQAEIDLLPTYQSQLTDIRASLRTFDLQVDEGQRSRGFISDMQRDFTQMHNDLSSLTATMRKYIDRGAR